MPQHTISLQGDRLKRMGQAGRSDIDWEEIEKEWRLGHLPVRALAFKHHLAPSTITRRSKKHRWTRDKTEEIRTRTKAGLCAQKTGNTVPTVEDIDKAVLTNIEVVRSHRQDIKKGRKIIDLLYDQLQIAVETREEIEAAIDEEATNQQTGKINNNIRAQLRKAVSIPAHAAVVRDLSTALKNLIPLERQAFNIDDQSSSESISIVMNFGGELL